MAGNLESGGRAGNRFFARFFARVAWPVLKSGHFVLFQVRAGFALTAHAQRNPSAGNSTATRPHRSVPALKNQVGPGLELVLNVLRQDWLIAD